MSSMMPRVPVTLDANGTHANRAVQLVVIRSCTVAVTIGLWFALVWAYRKNQPFLFLVGLGLVLTWGAIWLHLERAAISKWGWMAWQRLAAAVACFAVIETGFRLTEKSASHNVSEDAIRFAKPVTFAEAQGDPHAFAQWWDVYVAASHLNADAIQEFTPGGPVPYVFKPNTSRPNFRNQISVNSHQLCDREVPLDKGDKYRIVVMGSSHTMGPQIEADGTSWPAKLERLIHERVDGGDRIEVLNAAAAAYTMENNLHRLKDVVLPLKPDMIITYFGYNDYEAFREDFRLSLPVQAPRHRASMLLGRLEWRLTKWLSERSLFVESLDDPSALQPRLEHCRIARLYQEYLQVICGHGIDLVVCNFNMAIDLNSPQDVVRFYEGGFPEARYMIQANRLNDCLLPLVIRSESGVRWIDVQSGLNGEYQRAFVDLVHMSEIGKAQLAENVFRGIVGFLPQVANRNDKHSLHLVDQIHDTDVQ